MPDNPVEQSAAVNLSGLPEYWLHDFIERAIGLPAYPGYRSGLIAEIPSIGYVRSSTESTLDVGGRVVNAEVSVDLNLVGETYADAKAMAITLREELAKELASNFSGSPADSKIRMAYISEERDGEAVQQEGETAPIAYTVEITMVLQYPTGV